MGWHLRIHPIVLILLLGAALRLPLLTRDSRFQVDEALYATFARHVAQTGDLLLSGLALDKPPLLFWAMGGSFTLFGVSEFAARLPDVAASIVTVAIVYALTRRLYGDTFGARANQRVALIAALLLAVSPYDRGFAATAFTDPLLTMLVLAGCWAAVSGRWPIGGLLLAGAFAVKPSALQWLPLALALGATQMDKWQDALRGVLKLALGFAAGVIPLAIWSAARATWPDFWTLNWYNNNPGRLIRANELMSRLAQWGNWLQTIAPLPVIGWLAGPLHWRIDKRPSRAVVTDLILTAYTLGSLAELWLVAFNVYDRYLHTLAPLLLILLARVIDGSIHLTPRWLSGVGISIKTGAHTGAPLPEHVLCRGGPMCPPASKSPADPNTYPYKTPRLGVRFLLALLILALALSPPINAGGDPSTFAGIDRIAAALDKLPTGTIVYDHWLGWELGFYLGTQPPVTIIWQPTIDALIAAVRQQPGYLVAPRADSVSWRYLLQAAGIKLTEIEIPGAPGFVLDGVRG